MAGAYSISRRVLGERATEALRGRLQAYRLHRGHYDAVEREMGLVPRLVAPGETALDIGANIGVYTRLLSRAVGPAGHVHAFEPVPRTYARLRRHVARLTLPNATAYHAAIDRERGLTEVLVPDGGSTGMYRAHLARAGGRGRQHRVLALDIDSLHGSVFARVDFIKCDVEGAELAVLQGAARCLDQDRPRLLLEINDAARRFGSSAAEVFAWLAARDYAAWVHDGRRLRPCPKPGPQWGTPNYVFAPRGHDPLAPREASSPR